MRLSSIAATVALIGLPAWADSVDVAKVRDAIIAHGEIAVTEVLATRTTDDGTSTAYFRAQKGGRVEAGTATFVKMDDGRWFLTSARTVSGIPRSPFVAVDIE